MTGGHFRTGLALLATAALVAWSWSRGERFLDANGPTFDEPPHLAAGYSYWSGDFRLNPEHPPLLKLLWAAPLLFGDRPPYPHDVAAATNNDHWHVGVAFLYRSDRPPRALLDPARRVNLALGCGVVLLAGWWAFRVWNSRLAGVGACAFAVCDPNLLALSCVLTTDVGLTLFTLLACYLLWEYAAKPSRGLLIAAGVALGLALGSKFSALAAVAGVGAAGLVYVLRGGALALPGAPADVPRRRAAVEFAFRLGLIALVTLAATYGFVHFDQWGRGLKFQLTRADHGDGMMYLDGELSRTGWYHYFLVLLPLKLPLGLLAGASLALALAVRRALFLTSPLEGEVAGTGLSSGGWGRRAVKAQVASVPVSGAMPSSPPPPPASDEASEATSPSRGEVKNTAFLLVPPLVFFALASYSRVNLGVRVVLPVLPFLYVIAAGLALRPRSELCGAQFARRGRRAGACCRLAGRVLLGACVAWAAVSAARSDPHPIAYFNELAGGPRGAIRHVADSNVDWGQGLPELKAYLAANGPDVIYLSYFGTDRPEAYGIRFQPLPAYGRVGEPGGESVPADAPRHVLVVSANNLLGIYLNDPDTFAWLRTREPTAVLGGCLYVFDLTGDADATARVRALPTR